MDWWIASSGVGEEQRFRRDDFANGRKGISCLARLLFFFSRYSARLFERSKVLRRPPIGWASS